MAGTVAARDSILLNYLTWTLPIASTVGTSREALGLHGGGGDQQPGTHCHVSNSWSTAHYQAMALAGLGQGDRSPPHTPHVHPTPTPTCTGAPSTQARVPPCMHRCPAHLCAHARVPCPPWWDTLTPQLVRCSEKFGDHCCR